MKFSNFFKKNKVMQSESPNLRIKREFSQHPRLTPANLRAAYLSAEIGNITTMIDMFDDVVEISGQIRAEMPMRTQAVLEYDWCIEPPDDATDDEILFAEMLEEAIEAIEGFEDLLLSLASGVFYGFSCNEIEWYFDGKMWLPKKIYPRKHRWFKLNQYNLDEIRLRDNTANGEELEKYSWIVHVHGFGDISRLGLLRTLSWYAMYASYAINDFAEYLEIHGIPIIIGKYPDSTDKESKAALAEAVYTIGHKARGVIPSEMEVEIHEAAKSNAASFLGILNYCDDMISKILNHGTLNTGTGNGTATNALGNIHEKNKKNTALSDIKQYESTLNKQLLMAILEVNGLVADKKRLPRFEFETREPKDMAMFASSIPALVSTGVQIPVHWTNEQLDIPLPMEGEQVLSSPSQNQIPNDNNQTADTTQPAITPQDGNGSNQQLRTSND